MLDETPRVTFRLDDATYSQVQALAQRHEQSLSQLCRDALTRLLANTAPYLDLLSARVLQHHARPTPEQQANFAAYLRTYQAPDLRALLASMPAPPDANDMLEWT